MSACPSVNCTSWGDLQANSDIAGIGVMVAFVASAYITVILVIIYYLLGSQKSTSPVDKAIVKGFSNLWTTCFDQDLKPTDQWIDAIKEAILSFSDQQLVTGIGMLVSGYTQLRCSLDLYHWQIVVYLTWFSSLTHMTTLSALRHYFHEQPTLAYWRVFFMGCTIVLLATSLIPTGYASGDEPIVLAIPAQCLYSAKSVLRVRDALSSTYYFDFLSPFNTALIVLAILYLTFSYISRVVAIFEKPASTAIYLLRSKPGYYLKKRILSLKLLSEDPGTRFGRGIWSLLLLLLKACYILLKVMFDLGQSMLLEIFWLIAGLAWGTLRLISTWTAAHPEDETVWSFGQVLALLLLALPFLSLSENLFKKPEHPQPLPGIGTSAPSSRKINPDVIRRFQALHVESGDHWGLSLLTFGMAILIAADILYDFPAADIVPKTASLIPDGTAYLTALWHSLLMQYTIWFGMIGLVLFSYTVFCLGFGRSLWQCCYKAVFGQNENENREVDAKKVTKYLLVFFILIGTAAFDILLFYSPNPLSISFNI
ncbi:hypothetical protein BGZ57DRAFT_965715 [Hyaloscypha finlandica]|nr:hypothetical protein BGZ57DRAFT_965715 [Hyaloscypha finlandica]